MDDTMIRPPSRALRFLPRARLYSPRVVYFPDRARTAAFWYLQSRHAGARWV